MDFIISKEALYFYTPDGMVLRVKINKALPKFNINSHFFCLTFGIHLVVDLSNISSIYMSVNYMTMICILYNIGLFDKMIVSIATDDSDCR